MVYFQTKNPNLSKFWEALAIEDVGILLAILSILRPNGILYGRLVHFVVTFWHVVPRKKSGNPVLLFPLFISALV
jgi:hypothetical protein